MLAELTVELSEMLSVDGFRMENRPFLVFSLTPGGPVVRSVSARLTSLAIAPLLEAKEPIEGGGRIGSIEGGVSGGEDD